MNRQQCSTMREEMKAASLASCNDNIQQLSHLDSKSAEKKALTIEQAL